MRGELLVCLYPNFVRLELLEVRGKKRKLVDIEVENFNTILEDFGKVESLDIAKLINNFLNRSGFKKGDVNILIFGEKGNLPFEEIEMEVTKKSDLKKMLGFEIEDLGDFSNFDYRYEQVGNKVRVYFLGKEVVKNLQEIKLDGSWELKSILPGHLAYQGMVPEDGIILDINSRGYQLFAFKSGILEDVEESELAVWFGEEKESGVNELLSDVEEEVLDYVKKFNFSHGLDIDLVPVVYSGVGGSRLESRDVEGIYFDGVKDLRERFEGELTGASLGLLYLGDKLSIYNFAPEKLGIFYKNVLVGALTFSLSLSLIAPILGYQAKERVEQLSKEVLRYESNLVKLEELLDDYKSQLRINEERVSDYNEYVKSLEMLSRADNHFISDVMHYLPKNTPKSILFNNMRLDSSREILILQGHSESYKDIGSFAIELEKFGDVKVVDILDNNLDNDLGYPFELELKNK